MTLVEALRIARVVRKSYEAGQVLTLADCKFILDTMGATEVLREWVEQK